MPVFYLPMLYYPIQEDDRATGFLMPMYGSSLAMGSSISNAFFWAINRSQDATFFHDWMFSRGNGARRRVPLHARRRRRRATSAITGSTRRKRSSTAQPRAAAAEQDDPRRPQPEPAVRPVGARARRLLHRRHGAADLQPQLLQRLEQQPHASTAACPGRGATCRSTAVPAAPRRSTTTDDSTVSGSAPGFTAALSGVRLGPLPIFAHGQRRSRRDVLFIENFGDDSSDLGLIKADITPSIRAPLSTLPFLQVNATAAYRTTYYSESLADDLKTQIEVPMTRNYGDMRVDVVGPVFSRVFNPQQRDRRSHEARGRADVLGAAPHRDRQPGSHSDARPAPTTSSSAASRR